MERVSQVEYLKDEKSFKVSVTTSATLESLIGEALNDDVRGVTLIIGDNTLYYNPNGTATASNAFLPAAYTIWGKKEILDLVQLYAASSVDIGVITLVSANEPEEV